MIWAVVRTQWRLLTRTWGFWLVCLGAVALAVVATRGGTQSRMPFYFNELAVPFFFLGQMLITTMMAQQERSDRVEELIEALPYRVSTWLLGRFLLAYLLWLTISAGLWALGGLMVVAAGHPVDPGLLALNWAVIAPIALAFTTAASVLTGTLMRRGVLAYFATAAVWITGPFSLIVLSKSSERLPAPLGEYFASGRFFPLTATGYFINQELLLFNRLFTLGLAGAALALLLWLGARRRRRPALAAALALVLCTTLTAGAAAREVWLWGGINQAYDRELAATPRGQGRPAAATVQTDRYDLDLTLAPEARSLTAIGSLDVTNISGGGLAHVDLTLRQNFAVTAVTASNGTALPFQREGDRLQVTMSLAPGETRRLTVSWAGEVWQWRMDDGPKLGAHISAQSIHLPAHYGWYPLAGQHLLTMQIRRCTGDNCQPSLHDREIDYRPITATLRVSGSDLHLIHNSTRAAQGFYLIGTPFAPVAHGAIQVSVSAINQVEGARITAEVADLVAFYEALVPGGPGLLNLVESHDATYYGTPWAQTPNAFADTLVIHNLEVGRHWEGYFRGTYSSTIPRLWWPQDVLSSQNELYGSFTEYMASLQSKRAPQAYSSPGFRILVEVERSQGREAAAQVLRAMHALLPTGGPDVAAFEREVLRVADENPVIATELKKLRSRP